MGLHVGREREERALEDIGKDEVVGRAGPEVGMVEPPVSTFDAYSFATYLQGLEERLIRLERQLAALSSPPAPPATGPDEASSPEQQA